MGWINKWMNERTNNEQIHERWMNERIKEVRDEWMNERRNERRKEGKNVGIILLRGQELGEEENWKKKSEHGIKEARKKDDNVFSVYSW